MNPAAAFWLGAVSVLWAVTVVAVAYTIWRYVYSPWVVVRRDIAALNAKVDEHIKWTQETLTTRRLAAMTDEELASIERRLRRDSAARVSMGERIIR